MVKDSFMHVTFKRFRNDSMKKDLEITHTFCALFSVETIKDQKYNKKKKKNHQNILFFFKNEKLHLLQKIY